MLFRSTFDVGSPLGSFDFGPMTVAGHGSTMNGRGPICRVLEQIHGGGGVVDKVSVAPIRKSGMISDYGGGGE